MFVSALFILGVVPFLLVGGSCPGANPNDLIPDDAALQLCLDAGGMFHANAIFHS